MNKKSGFTLIELLAVIVILAVIALIATPLIMGVIDDARKGSAKNGAYGYVKAMENTIATEMIKDTTISPDSPQTEVGKVTFTPLMNSGAAGTKKKADINYKGTKPDRHNLVITNGTVGNGSCIVVSGYGFKMENNEWMEMNAENCVSEDSSNSPVSFANDSWETIITAAHSGNTSAYKVGDTKEIELTDLGTFKLRVANNSNPTECNTPGFSQSACGFVLEFEGNVTQYAMNSTRTNIGGWPASEVRTYLNGEFLNLLPEIVKNNVKDTVTISGHGATAGETNFTSTDKIYLLSSREVWGLNTSSDTAVNETRQLDYYQEQGVTSTNYSGAIKKYASGSASNWLLRSPVSNYTGYFICVGNSGSITNGFADLTRGVSPAFRL